MKKRITQKHIATLAKVSPMTVSLALRESPLILAETRRRIQKIAKQNGYRPDPALAALNAYRIADRAHQFQGVISWVTAFPSASAWREMLQTQAYFHGACQRADELGYRLEEFWVADPELTMKRATRILTSRNIRGVIIAPLPQAGGEISLEWEHFSAVALGYSLAKPHLHVVMNYQFRNMMQTVHQLSELGYRRIGMTMPSASDRRVNHGYLGGFLSAQCDLPPSAHRLAPALTSQFDKAFFLRWFRKEKPDAVVVSAAYATDVIQWLAGIGKQVPRDIGLAVASIPFEDHTITGIDENAPLIGRVAVDTVVGMIHRNDFGIPVRPSSTLLEGVWVEGKTTRTIVRKEPSLPREKKRQGAQLVL